MLPDELVGKSLREASQERSSTYFFHPEESSVPFFAVVPIKKYSPVLM